MKLIIEIDNVRTNEEAAKLLTQVKELLGAKLTGQPRERLELTAQLDVFGKVLPADQVLDIDW